MAAPNIVNVTSIYGQTTVSNLTTVTSNVITNAAASNQVYKINNIMLSNYSNAAVGANVIINRSGTNYYLGGSVSVPSFSTLVLIGKDTSFYLLEGDVIQANVTANTSLTLTSSYEQIS